MIRIFRHYVSKTQIFLSLIEATIILCSFYLAHAIRFPGEAYEVSSGLEQFSKAVIFTFIITSCLMALGLYDRRDRETFSSVMFRIVFAFAGALVFLSLLFYAIPSLFVGRGVLGLEFAIAFVAICIVRLIYGRYLSDSEVIKDRLLVLGTGEKAATIDRLLRRRGDRRTFSIVGYVALPGEPKTVKHEAIIDHDSRLVEIARNYQVDELVIAVEDSRNSFPIQEVLECKMNGINVVDLLSFFEEQSGKILISLLKPSWLIFSDGFQASEVKVVMKRFFDLLASIVLLAITWPIMLVTAIAIECEGWFRQPVLYIQQRVGENGRPFNLVKFRSMAVDAEKDGKACWASNNDDRITRVGAIIRKLRIDELPQIINVLRGEMSFVGPRPERPQFVEDFARDIPYYNERHRVKPGITGWAQVSYPYGASQQDSVEKLQYDLYYVKNFSLFLDLMIIFHTVRVVLWGKGAR